MYKRSLEIWQLRGKQLSIHFALFIILMLLAIHVSARLIRPEHGPEPERLNISGHSRNYYRLDAENSLNFVFENAQRVRVITRVVIPEGAGEQNYVVEYQADSQSPRQFKSGAAISPVVEHTEIKNLQFGKSQSLYLTIPEGSHSYRFYLPKGSDETVYLRMIAAKMDQKEENGPEMVQLRPAGAAEKTTLLYKDVKLTYYAITNDRTAEISVNGPTTLRIYSRLQFEYWMEGEVTYRIQALEDGLVNGTYQLSSERSETTVYQDDGELIPGKWRRFEIKVSEGRHTYEFRMADGEYSSLIKIELPEDGVSAE